MINTYYAMLIGSVSYFFNFGKSYQEANAAHSRIKEIESIPYMISGDVKIQTQIKRINIENLSFNYGLAKVIENLSIEFRQGKSYCLYGRNGKGKTTLIDIMSGLYNDKYLGHLQINNYELNDIDINDFKENYLSVCDQDATFILETVYEELSLNEMKVAEMKRCLIALNIKDETVTQGLYNLFDVLINDNKASSQLSR